jgi:hypothetical protein
MRNTWIIVVWIFVWNSAVQGETTANQPYNQPEEPRLLILPYEDLDCLSARVTPLVGPIAGGTEITVTGACIPVMVSLGNSDAM